MVCWTLTIVEDFNSWQPDTILVISLALGGVALLSVIAQQQGRLLGIGGVYLTYLLISHLGVVGVLLVNPLAPSISAMPSWTLGWVGGEGYVEGALLSGVASATLAFVFARPWALSQSQLTPMIQRTAGGVGIYRVGLVLLLVSGVYLGGLAATGLLPINQGYMVYREAMELVPGYAVNRVILATGLTFIAATIMPGQALVPLVLLSLPVTILFITGARGEALYPIMSGLGILAHRGLRLNRGVAGFGILLLFIGIPLINVTRTAFNPLEEAQSATLSPDAVFTEVGFTLRPLATTLEWYHDGEPVAEGRTYAVPFARTILVAIPLIDRPSLTNTNWDIADRLNGQGYSVVAEAILNFGPWGVVPVFCCIGLLLSRATRVTTDVGLAFIGGLLAIGLNNIRNGFAFVPGQIIIVLTLVVAGAWWGRTMNRVDTPHG